MNSSHRGVSARPSMPVVACVVALILVVLAVNVPAHGVAEDDKAFFEGATRLHLIPFIYLGAKQWSPAMTICYSSSRSFFLYRLKEVAAYVTLFAIGHRHYALVW